jgi:hypothetical protein
VLANVQLFNCSVAIFVPGIRKNKNEAWQCSKTKMPHAGALPDVRQRRLSLMNFDGGAYIRQCRSLRSLCIFVFPPCSSKLGSAPKQKCPMLGHCLMCGRGDYL